MIAPIVALLHRARTLDPSAIAWLAVVGLIVAQAFAIARARRRDVVDWWLTLAALLVVALASALFAPMFEGAIAAGAFVLFDVLPIRLEAASTEASRRGDDRRAERFAKLAAALHPFGGIGVRSRSLAASRTLRSGGSLDAATLRALGADDPVIGAAWALAAAHSAGDYARVRELMSRPAQRRELLGVGTGAPWLAAIAALGRADETLDAYDEVLARDPTAAHLDVHARLLLLVVSSFGDVEATATILERLGDRVPAVTIATSRARAAAASGKKSEAFEVLDRATAAHRADPIARRTLAQLRDAIAEDRVARPLRANAPVVREALQRRVDDLLAAFALAPLDEPSRVRAPFITSTSIALVAIFAASTQIGDPADGNFLLRIGGLRAPMRGADDAWRLLTYAVLHGSWEHVGFNVLALWSLGRFVEAFFGTRVAALIFVVGAVLSGLAVHALADEAHARVLVGASGAIFALGGAAVAAIALRRDLRGSRRGRALLQNLLVAFAAQALLDHFVPAISSTAHLAGLAVGALLGAAFVPRAAR